MKMGNGAQAFALALAMGLGSTGTAWALTLDDQAIPTTRDLKVVQQPMTEVKPAVQAFEVKASVDREDQTYRIGERVVFRVTSSEDAYITLVDVGTSGEVTILFPNQYQQDNRVRAGETVEIPSPGAGFGIEVGGPTGLELIKVLATRGPTPVFDPRDYVAHGPFHVLNEPVAVVTRNLIVVMEEEHEQGWAEDETVIRIVDAEHAAVVRDGESLVASGTSVEPQAAETATETDVSAVAEVAETAVIEGAEVAETVVEAPANQGPAEPASIEETAPPVEEFALTLRTDATAYAAGDILTLTAHVDMACKLTLLDVDTTGKTRVLFPNRAQPDNRMAPERALELSYTVAGPSGIETVIGVCRTDDEPVYPGVMNLDENEYQPWDRIDMIAKELASLVDRANPAIAHDAVTMIIVE